MKLHWRQNLYVLKISNFADEIYEGIDPLIPETAPTAEKGQMGSDGTGQSLQPSRSPAASGNQKVGSQKPASSTEANERSKSRQDDERSRKSQRVSVSPELGLEQWKDKTVPRQPKPQHVVLGMPLIPTGAKFTKDDRTFSIYNTCNVDTTIQILYYLNTYTSAGQSFFQNFLQSNQFSGSLRRIFETIDNENFDDARIEWIESVVGQELVCDDVSIYGSESENGTSKFSYWLKCVKRTRKCVSKDCGKQTARMTSLTEIKGYSPDDILDKLHKGELLENWCTQCRQACRITYECTYMPDILVYTCDGMVTEGGKTTNRAMERDLPMLQNIFGTEYEVVAYTLYTRSHFYAVVVADGVRYTVDGQKSAVEHRSKLSNAHSVSSVWLSRKY